MVNRCPSETLRHKSLVKFLANEIFRHQQGGRKKICLPLLYGSRLVAVTTIDRGISEVRCSWMKNPMTDLVGRRESTDLGP